MPSILLVDDEAKVTDNLRRLFEKNKYTIFIAPDGQKAIDRIKEHKPDLVFLDIEMPNLNGIAVLKFIKKDFPNTKVVVLTGYDAEYRSQIEQIGVESIQAKPYPLNRLLNLADAILEHKPIPKEKNPLYIDSRIMPKAKLLFIEPSHLMAGAKFGYFDNPDKCGGKYASDVIIELDQMQQKLKDFKPDIVLTDISMFNLNPNLQSDIMDSEYKPKEIIVYGTESDFKSKKRMDLKERIDKAEAKFVEGDFDPLTTLFVKGHMDKLGKIVRETAIDNELYEKVKARVHIPGRPDELEPVIEKRPTPAEIKPQDIPDMARRIIAEQLGVDKDQIVDNTDLAQDLGMDSLASVELIMALEEKLDVEIPDTDAEGLTKFRQIVDYIQKKLAQEKGEES